MCAEPFPILTSVYPSRGGGRDSGIFLVSLCPHLVSMELSFLSNIFLSVLFQQLVGQFELLLLMSNCTIVLMSLTGLCFVKLRLVGGCSFMSEVE